MVNLGLGMPKTTRLLKVPLILLNALLWLFGIILVIVGGVAVSFFSNFKDFAKDSGSYKSALSQITTGAPAGVLVIGIFFIILTIVGCFVAYKEKLVGLVLYTVLILALLVVLIGLAGSSLNLHNEDVVKQVEESWAAVSNSSKNSTITKLESFLECCTWNGYNVDTQENKNLCPIEENDNDDSTSTSAAAAGSEQPVVHKYTDKACKDVMSDQISSKLWIVGIFGIIIGLISFVCMLFALFLIIRICRSPRSRSYDQY